MYIFYFSDEKGLKICTELHLTKNLMIAFGWKTGTPMNNLTPTVFWTFLRHWRFFNQHHQRFWNGNLKWSLQINKSKFKFKTKRAKSFASIARYFLISIFLGCTSYACKVHIFWEGHKILRNLHLTFVLCSASKV